MIHQGVGLLAARSSRKDSPYTINTPSLSSDMAPLLADQKDPVPFNLTDLDRETLGQTDEEFIPHDWEDLKSIIGRFLHQTDYPPLIKTE